MSVAAGEVVCRQNSIALSMFFIAEGLVEVYAPTESGEGDGPLLKLLEPPSFFGEAALFTGVRSTTVAARTPATLLVLSAADFLRLSTSFPHFTALMKGTAKRRVRKYSLIMGPGSPKSRARSIRGSRASTGITKATAAAMAMAAPPPQAQLPGSVSASDNSPRPAIAVRVAESASGQ
jgi:CRP-like cAMP-binding protein